MSSSESTIAPVRAAFQQEFFTLLYFCYKRNFKPLLQRDMEQVETFLSLTCLNENQKRQLKIGYTNDIGWGCTLRVAQMLIAHTILRHKLKDYTLKTLIQDKNTYLKMLRVMHDNADGRNGAFSIQNIVRMSLLYNKYPGEWHGPGSISNVFKDLNKLY